jgi:hypothetical protein
MRNDVLLRRCTASSGSRVQVDIRRRRQDGSGGMVVLDECSNGDALRRRSKRVGVIRAQRVAAVVRVALLGGMLDCSWLWLASLHLCLGSGDRRVVLAIEVSLLAAAGALRWSARVVGALQWHAS